MDGERVTIDALCDDSGMRDWWERARVGLLVAVAAAVVTHALWPHGPPDALNWAILALILALFAVTALRPRRRWP